MKLNFNETKIRVRLTPEGKAAHDADYALACAKYGARLDYVRPADDADGWSKWELGWFMQVFGRHIHSDNPLMFEPEIYLVPNSSKTFQSEDEMDQRTLTALRREFDSGISQGERDCQVVAATFSKGAAEISLAIRESLIGLSNEMVEDLEGGTVSRAALYRAHGRISALASGLSNTLCFLAAETPANIVQ